MKYSFDKLNLETNLFLLGMTLALGIGILLYVRFPEITWIYTDSSVFRSTEGEITSSKLIGKGVRSGGLHFQIFYSYKVAGVSYISDRVHFGATASEFDYAASYVHKYSAGRQVTVYYDPNKPSVSVLEPEVKWYGLLNFTIGMSTLALSFFGFSGWTYFRKRR